MITDPAWLDPTNGYPANEMAYVPMLERLRDRGAASIVEVGVGAGRAIPVLADAGLAVRGLDIDEAKVEESRTRAEACGQDPDRIIRADIEDAASCTALGQADALLSLGVLPHVRDEVRTLVNMRSLVRPGGDVFVEFRNALFSLVTFNRYTCEFIVDDLLADVDPEMRDRVRSAIEPRVRMDLPPTSGHSRFHVPFEMPALFARAGYVDAEVIPFHYHAGMPFVEAEDPVAFRVASLALEHETSGWRGLFLCSAFLVRATVPPA